MRGLEEMDPVHGRQVTVFDDNESLADTLSENLFYSPRHGRAGLARANNQHAAIRMQE